MHIIEAIYARKSTWQYYHYTSQGHMTKAGEGEY
jgi:hypothetical protein